MLVRNVLRLAADMPAKTTPHDLPQLARLFTRTLLARNASFTPAGRALSRAYVAALSNNCRTYATTTRASSATKPTTTVKKAVKAAATKKPATKKKKTTTAKTAAAKPKKKPAPKKKKKAVAKKAAPKKRVKKAVTPEAKEHADILALKKRALVAPTTIRSISALNAFIAESASNNKGTGPAVMKTILSDAAVKFKSLTPAEVEHYNHIANEQTTEKRKVYQAWVHSYTPAQIQDANNARATLRRRFSGKSRLLKHASKIQDDRVIKRPANPYALFFRERVASGDFKSIRLADAAKLAGQEWKALTAAEKKKYEDMAGAEKARYQRDLAAQ